MKTSIKIALAQLNLIVGKIENNTDIIIQAIHKSEKAGIDIILFPELSLCSYPPEDLLFRSQFYLKIEQALSKVVESTGNIRILLGHPYKQNNLMYNACSLITDNKIEKTYLKQHLPNYGVFDEKRYFREGNESIIFEVNRIKCAISICEDIWAKEPIDIACKNGADIMFNINASPFHRNKLIEREAIIKQRAKESGMYIVYNNLVGGQDELVFDGNSTIVCKDGKTIFHAPPFEEGIFNFELNSGKNPIHIPPDIPEEESIYKALVLGVKDYIRKNNFNGAIIGLSGGIDSALTLCIAVDALGAENVEAISMPSRFTADMSNEDAFQQTEKLNVRHEVLSIEKSFNSIIETLEPRFNNLPVDTTEENIQARCRGIILMAISNKTGKLVLTTGNKSEMAVGYATLYGDMAGGFAPLKDIWKTMVYRLANWRNSISPAIPERVITRPPSAELRPDQLDQDSLPDYSVLDPILEQYIENDCPPEKIITNGYDPDDVFRVINMVDRNEYKRRQAAPGIRITERAFGRDRRYPITSGYSEKE